MSNNLQLKDTKLLFKNAFSIHCKNIEAFEKQFSYNTTPCSLNFEADVAFCFMMWVSIAGSLH